MVRRVTPTLDTYPFRISYGPADDRLHDFYLPALERSTRFDRTTGFFSSAALAIAAAGIVRLIANGGKMRLLCGAQLSEQDVEAIRRGAELKDIVGQAMAGCLADPTDRSMRARLEALAWMVANGRLEIRVVLPRDADGLPLPASEAREYYHPKEGLFEDAAGNKLAFSGSSNDSVNGWQWNYEVFSVYATWPLGKGADGLPALTPYVAQVERRFERLWRNEEDSWASINIPEAARKKLLTCCPAEAPSLDPLEERPGKPLEPEPSTDHQRAVLQRERLIFRFLREAPFLPNAHRIGIETSTVAPWPHQLRVVQQAVERYPENFLFCDEVGLGKTIEAGLVLRQLVISGRVRRGLLLVPKSIMKQWQEELYEKFVLNIPRYDGGTLKDVFDRDVPWSGASVWGSCPLLLASSQLAKRRERQAEVLAAEPWDLVIVDEAHHARRKDFLTDRYRANRLLELLAGTQGRPGLKDRTNCLYLMTATPMQVHPVEVWDLLKVLGLGGRWGALQENFLEYFQQLRRSFGECNWDFVLTMMRDFLDAGGSLDPIFCDTAERELGFVEWDILKSLPSSAKPKNAIAQLSNKGRAFLVEMAKRHTPLRTRMWRNTRSLLRKYREKGVLKEVVPRREPRNEWIPLTKGPGGEQELYDRIEEYISDFYRRYEAERKGLGFVMTVYRRRLTSSFYALEKSLERRRDFLKGKALPAGGLTDDDLEQDDLDTDISEELSDEDRALFKGELEYVEDFLHDLKALGSDSKLERLIKDVNAFFKRRDTVIIFTQYTDTMDNLREQLRQVYGGQVACYSGRGGECWDGVAWVPRTKESVKEQFRKGEEIKILLCTEAASEGLNLQTCGVLVNYDMPWNPMRVEQRIGRIDRIGQRFEDVWIRNYFYQDTVEATVYQRLGDRISWFEEVIGELQPILNRVARVIEQAAMMKGSERKRRLDEEIAAIRQEIDSKTTESLDLGAYVDERLAGQEAGPPPVTLQDLERAVVGSKLLGKHFKPHPTVPSAHLLSWGGEERAVTFSPEVFDQHPYTVELLSYGNPLLDQLLQSAGEPPSSDEPTGIGLLRTRKPTALSIFVYRNRDGGMKALQTLGDFSSTLEENRGGWDEADTSAAIAMFSSALEDVVEQLRRVDSDRYKAELLALTEEARQILIRTALVELAEGQNPDLFDEALPHGFGSEAVQALKRHGTPYKALLKIAGAEELSAEPTHPFFLALQGLPPEALKRRHEALRQEGLEVVQKYAVVTGSESATVEAAGAASDEVERRWYAPPQPAHVETSARDVPGSRPKVIPLPTLPREKVRPFENCVPLYDLKVAAGRFSEEQFVDAISGSDRAPDPDDYTWVEIGGRTRPATNLFVAQVVGESMNRRISNGAYCLFRLHPHGTRQGMVVLAQHRDIHDTDFGGHFTVKVYDSIKEHSEDGTWRHKRIILKPDSTDPTYKPIVLENLEEGGAIILAELVEVLTQ
jgi:ERCC4-related helicase